MKVGSYTVTPIIFDYFRLDGGSMFGSVPKALWQKSIAPDADNCIPLACRCLLLEGNDRKILIDVGMGSKWNEKARAIYGLKSASPPPGWPEPHEITDVILTHLHFDHAGGISQRTENDAVLALTYPNATVHLQRANWEHAQSPTLKDRASYLAENITPLQGSQLTLLDGDSEILPGIWGHRVDGHTRGQQWIEVRDSDTPQNSLFFATDLIPTSHHLPLPYHMGYDVCAETLLREKELFLVRAMTENSIIVFEHDTVVEGVRVHLNERGHYAAKEFVTL